jgi:hypothetical protein
MSMPMQFERLIEQDGKLAELAKATLSEPEHAKKLITHLQSEGQTLSRNDLKDVLGKNGGYLDRILKETAYQPLECSTGVDLNQAIGSIPRSLPRSGCHEGMLRLLSPLQG